MLILLSSSNNKDTKNLNKKIYIKATNIGNICIKDIYVRSIFNKNVFSIISIILKMLVLKILI